MSPRLAAILAAVVSVLGAFVIAVSVDNNGRPTVTIRTANNKQVTATEQSVQAAANGAEDYLIGPGFATPAQERSSDQANPQAPRVRGLPPLASPFQRGCLTRSNRYNFSPRNGTRPSIIVVHLPVAYNHPGWGDVNGVHVFLDRPSTMASSNYQNDDEGNCILAVAETYKAWAQSNYNSATACSIEQQAYGNERTFLTIPGPGLRQLATIVHDCARRWGIKLQVAKVDGHGGVIREGVIDHAHLGAAGGGHVDIHGFGHRCRQEGAGADTLACVRLIIDAARSLDVKPIAARQRKRCYLLNHLRRRSARYRRRHHLPPARHPLTAKDKRLAKRILAGERRFKLRCRLSKRPHLVRA